MYLVEDFQRYMKDKDRFEEDAAWLKHRHFYILCKSFLKMWYRNGKTRDEKEQLHGPTESDIVLAADEAKTMPGSNALTCDELNMTK